MAENASDRTNLWLCVNSLLIPASSHLNLAGLQSCRRPDGVLRRAHTRGPPHHAAAGLWEPLPGEEVLLHHPLMSRAQGAAVAWLLRLHHTWSYRPERPWVEFLPPRWTLCCRFSSVLVAGGFRRWACEVGHQTGNPVSVSCLVNSIGLLLLRY